MRGGGTAEDQIGIRELIELYSDACIQRDVDTIADLWVEDGEWGVVDMPELVGRGKAAILEKWKVGQSFFPQAIVLCLPGMIRVTGATATCRTYTMEVVTSPEGRVRRAIGTYDDAFRKEGGRWYFSKRIGEVQERRISQMCGDTFRIHPGDQALPGFLFREDQRVIDIAAIGAEEMRRLGRRWLGVAASLPLHRHARIKPERVRILDVHSGRVMHRDVDDLAAPARLSLDQRQHHADARETGRAMRRLRPAGIDRGDRMIVIATAVQRPAQRHRDQFGRFVVRPWPGQAERRD